MVGPLGEAPDIPSGGHIVGVGGGYGSAALLCLMRELRDRGERTTIIMGAREKGLLILADELGEICDNVEICTDDGSAGFHGFVTERLQEMIDGMYERFLGIVRDSRPIDEHQLQTLADGRVFSGQQAEELGLVDALGDLHRAADMAAGIAGKRAVHQGGGRTRVAPQAASKGFALVGVICHIVDESAARHHQRCVDTRHASARPFRQVRHKFAAGE